MKFSILAVQVLSSIAPAQSGDCEDVAPVQGYATQVAPKGYATQVAPVNQPSYTQVSPVGYQSPRPYTQERLPARGYTTRKQNGYQTKQYKATQTGYHQVAPVKGYATTTTCDEVHAAPVTPYAKPTTVYEQVNPAQPAYTPITGAYAYGVPAPIESAAPVADYNPIPTAVPSPMVEVAPIAPSGSYSEVLPTSADLPASPSSPYSGGGLYATDADYEQVLPSSAGRASALLAIVAVFVL